MTHFRPSSIFHSLSTAKNDLILSYKKVDLIKHLQTKSDLLWQLQVQKEKLFQNLPIDDLKEFNERIYPQSPRYGMLYE